jgi:uncharacterized membrane-anchored protein
MEENILQIEEQIRTVVRSVLNGNKTRLNEAGFSSEKIYFEKSKQTEERYSSLFEITFWADKKLFERIQFHVFREGKAGVQADEVGDMLEQRIGEIVQAKKNRGKE